MATARRTKTKGVKALPKKKPKVERDMSEFINFIPEGEVLEAPENFIDYVFLVYGDAGVGKTSTMAQAPGAYVVQCDRNRLGLSIRQSNVPNDSLATIKKSRTKPTPWEIIVAIVDEILKDPSVKTVIFDNFKKVYLHASNHYCKKCKVDSLSDMDDFGVSWNLVDAMYMDLFSTIVDSGRGLGLITHQKEDEVTLPSGRVFSRIQPDLSGRPFQAMKEMTNFVFYLAVNGKAQRELTIRHDTNDIMVKCSTDEDVPRFFTPDGKHVKKISMGNSPQQGWKNLMLSWDNKLACAAPVKKILGKKGKKKVTKKKVTKKR